MRKLYTIILLAFIGLSSKVNAQIVNIPDTNFYKALLLNGVHDSAGYITIDTAKAFKGSLNIASRSIFNLTGIEAFTGLTTLYCVNNYLDSLDISSNTSLTYLNCTQNTLRSLKVSGDAALSALTCGYNLLTTLDVSLNAALTSLGCAYNNLKSLNVSSNTALTGLDCSFIGLTSLNVKNGNNVHMPGNAFNAIGNTELTCIEVDSVEYSYSNWYDRDMWASFNTNCATVSINETAASADVNIYPNPVSTQLTIETNGLKAASVNIYDVMGQLMYSRNLTDNTVTIDMNAAHAAVYLIQIIDADTHIINRRIIKQ